MKVTKICVKCLGACADVFYVGGSHASNRCFHELDLLKHHMLGDATSIVIRIEHVYPTYDASIDPIHENNG